MLGFLPGAGNTTALPLPLLVWSLAPQGTEADSYSLRHTTDGEMRPHAVYISEAEATRREEEGLVVEVMGADLSKLHRFFQARSMSKLARERT